MNYQEKLLCEEAKLELLVEGFDKIASKIVFGGTSDFYAKFEPYLMAIMEQKNMVEYLRKEFEREKAKEE